MRPTEPLSRQHAVSASGGVHNSKLLRLKIKQHASSSQSTSSQHAALDPHQQAPSSSSSSSSQQAREAPASSLLYSTQLWQATGYSFHRQTVDRDVYFAEVLHPAPTFKQPPPVDGMQGPAGQQKRAKLLNGQYRARAAAGSSPACAAAELTHSGTAAHTQPFSQHITPNLAAAAAMAAAAASAAADQRRAGSALVSPSSSSCSHDGAGYGQQWQQQQQRPSDGWNLSSSTQQRLRVLPVPWPLAVTVKGRRSSRQRRTNMAQWQAVLQQPSQTAAPAAADSAMEVELQQQQGPVLQQQLPQLEHQQSGVSLDMQQQQECFPLPSPASSSPLQLVLQERPLRPLQQQANTHQQQQPAPPVKQRQQQQPQQRKEAVALVSSALAPATPIMHAESAAGGKQQLSVENAAGAAGEGSTSSEQTHDGMNDSPRDPARGLLSSWPSSSTDSVCQLQQQLLLQQGKACAAAVQRKGVQGAATGAPGTWASPTSPLPASSL